MHHKKHTQTYIAYVYSLQVDLGVHSTLELICSVANLFQFNDPGVSFITKHLQVDI